MLVRRSALAVALALVVAGCADDGRELRAPSPEQTTTSTTLPSTTEPSTTSTAGPTTGGDGGTTAGGNGPGTSTTAAASATLELTSPAFGEGQPIPAEHTCVGEDVSPPLTWSGVPDGTAELALVVRDPDADGFVHWVVAGLPAATEGLAAGNTPAAAVEALNDFGRAGWSGPCPPSGTHSYDFRLYALSQPTGVSPDTDGVEAAEQIESSPALASAALSGTVDAVSS